ncbi:MAG: DNA polymerase III subunit alpha [Rhodospirillaceae bacterium]|nr:DNA polymerase III subunit alpha [Rhodospirillaceae bacterium]
MSHADFIHLRVHSAYSLSEGALKIGQIADLCTQYEMPAVAITDTNNLFGALEFSLSLQKSGVQPIIGCQITVKREDASGEARGLAGDQLVLLAQSEEGYGNLLKLSSVAYLAEEEEHSVEIAFDELEAHAAGLIAFTGGPAGPIGRMLADGQEPAAIACLEKLKAIFPDRLYVELMRHGRAVEAQIENRLIDLAYAHDLPLIATNEVFFADREMHGAHDALICIAAGATVAEENRRRETPEHYFKSAAEMKALFADIPEAIENTIVVAQRCAFVPQTRDPILPAYPQLEGRTEMEALREMASKGLDKRLEKIGPEHAPEEYRERLEFELKTIEDMGYAGYFLIVADFIQWAKDQGIPVGPGRGSGAGSVVAWSLTITDLDPLRWGLLFERFLNPERISMPDFDIDFCKNRRDEVIEYVQQVYGRGRVAQIITFGKLEARAALRDVGRVLGMSYGQVDRICKLVPYNPAKPIGLEKAIESEPALQNMIEQEEGVAQLFDVARKLEGLFRHASTHAAGVVIGDRPLDELVPLYRDPRSDMPVTQFNMKYVEMAGLVKFDFLGLKTLTVLSEAQALLQNRKIEIEVETVPLEDTPTYEMFCRGETTGVFQLESSGMRDVIRKLGPDRFEDIIALVSLYRPGPMDNIPSYIARKHGEEKPDYMHPLIEDILKETHGIMIYQEQVMQIAQELSGYTLGGADLLRRAMGKKIQAEMDAQRKAFIEGALENDVDQGLAGHIFEQVNKFAGYGFNKSHAAAYALVAYQTGFLKANYPVEFMAASMSLDMGNTDKLNAFRVELDRLEIDLLPPDVNASGANFTVQTKEDGTLAVRYALGALKNVGAEAMRMLVKEREENGLFESIFDFSDRLDTQVVNKRQMENLARAGAFDGLNPNRQQVFLAVELLLRHAGLAQSERESNQANLFGDALGQEALPPLPDISDWGSQERLQEEFTSVGFYLSAHPLEAYKNSFERMKISSWKQVAAGDVRDTIVKLAGIVAAKRVINGKRGKLAFVQMSDMSGVYEITVFSELLSGCSDLLEGGAPLLVHATVQPNGDDFRVTATRIEALEEAASRAAAGLQIFLRDEKPVTTLSSVIKEHGVKGSGRVSLMLDLPDQDVEIDLEERYRITPQFRAAVKSISGVVDVRDI